MHPNNKDRRHKYTVARFFGATIEQARYARQLNNDHFRVELEMLVL